MAASLEARFWPKVDRGSTDECWPWLAWRDRHGYGMISRGGRGNGMAAAHRVAYELLVGPIPGRLELEAYTPENTNHYRGSRFCRECKRIDSRERKRRKRAEARA